MRFVDDTHPSVRLKLDETFRGWSTARKLERVAQLNAVAREVALGRIRAEHPNESEREHRLRYLLLTTSRHVVERLMGPLPELR